MTRSATEEHAVDASFPASSVGRRDDAPTRSLAEVFDAPSAEPTLPMLSLRDVEVHFGGIAALSGLTFDVDVGHVVAVVGPNGAGKSTMLNAISGLVRESSRGTIHVGGHSVLGKSPVAIARAGVGRTFQDPSLIDSESALTNVMVGQHQRLGYRMTDQVFRRRHVRSLEDQARERGQAVLNFMDLGSVRDQPVSSLSYGTRKLIDIARAIASGPRLLLLDEPTSGLDSDEQRRVGRILAELRSATPVSILIVEHHMHVVHSIADSVVGLEAGAVVAIGPPRKVLDSPDFQRAVTGSSSGLPH